MSSCDAETYAAVRGTGPTGETCGSCQHCWKHQHHLRRIYKCHMPVDGWPRGTYPYIKATAAACSQWVKRADKTTPGVKS